mgnify:CR=1 FL=1
MRSLSILTTSRSDLQVVQSILPSVSYREWHSINLLYYQDLDVSFIPATVKRYKIPINSSVTTHCHATCGSNIILKILSCVKHSDIETVLFIIGDRSELVLFSYHCLMLDIPVIHHSGGDITNGAIDNQARDAITAMSDFHLTSHSFHTERVIQLGENIDRVWTVGEPALNVLKSRLENEVSSVGQPLRLDSLSLNSYILGCFHSSTQDDCSIDNQIVFIKDLLSSFRGTLLLTHPNSDYGGLRIHQAILDIANQLPNIIYISALGEKYFEALLKCNYVIGNSSSGIFEAPLALKRSINIGQRQEGRLQSKSVMNIEYSISQYKAAVKHIEETSNFSGHYIYKSPYFNSDCLLQISSILSDISRRDSLIKKKKKSFS